MAIKTAFKIT